MTLIITCPGVQANKKQYWLAVCLLKVFLSSDNDIRNDSKDRTLLEVRVEVSYDMKAVTKNKAWQIRLKKFP